MEEKKTRVICYPDLVKYHIEVMARFDNTETKVKLALVRCKSSPHQLEEHVFYKVEGENATVLSNEDAEDVLRRKFPKATKFCRE